MNEISTPTLHAVSSAAMPPKPDRKTRKSRSTEPENAALVIAQHAFVGMTIVLVAASLVSFATLQLSVATPLALAIGAAFATATMAAHVAITASWGKQNASTLPTSSERQPVVSPKTESTSHLGYAPPSTASAAADEAGPSAFPGQLVEPSDLALALLASLDTRPQDATISPEKDDWSRALAAQFQEPPATTAYEAGNFDVPAAQTGAQSAPGSPVYGKGEAESEYQRVDRLVRRLADNVNQLQSMRRAEAVDQLSLFAANETPDAQIEASINALRRSNAETANEVLNTASPTSAPPLSPPEWRPATPDLEGRNQRADQRMTILDALNAQRIDVSLEPILDLADQRAQHYEVSIALRTTSGHAINLAQAAIDLSGTGLLPLIDQARIASAAQIARKLAARGKQGSVFADMTGESLQDGRVADTFADPSAGDYGTVGGFPGQLVLSLPQAHVASFSNADWQTLARLRSAGFSFALSSVTTLDMAFDRLAQAGFAFARLDAAIFLDGLPAAAGPTGPMHIAPSDICRHLASCGLTLIVGGIVEDRDLARIYGFGVLFGQGPLFGSPRPVKAEAVRRDQPVPPPYHSSFPN